MLTHYGLAKLIREHMRENGLTQWELAYELNLFPHHLSMMLNAKRGFNKIVCDYFKVEKRVLYLPNNLHHEKLTIGNEDLICS